MATVFVLMPALSATDPINGLANFWQSGNGEGQWTPVNNADIGVCQQAIDTEYIVAGWDQVSPPASGGFDNEGTYYFLDVNTVPIAAHITAVQFVINFTAIDMDLGEGQGYPLRFQPEWGLAGSANVVGVTDAFTGSGTFYTAELPTNPATGLPWVYEDLYGAALPFTDPKGFQGWWALNGAHYPVDFNADSSIQINYVACAISYDISSWYYNPITNHYVYESVNPGAPWILQTPGVIINQASSSAISGSGFGDGATISSGGSVVNSNLITGTTLNPGWNVITVTNPDGNSYTTTVYVEGLQWKLQRFDIRLDPEENL